MGPEEQNLEREAQTLIVQAELLIQKLEVDVSGFKPEIRYSNPFQNVSDIYEKLAFANDRTDQYKWSFTLVDGRNGAELMRRIWTVREALKQRDSTNE